MSAKSEAQKILANIETLAAAYERAKGKPMEECSLSRRQMQTIGEASLDKDTGAQFRLGNPPTYKGIRIKQA